MFAAFGVEGIHTFRITNLSKAKQCCKHSNCLGKAYVRELNDIVRIHRKLAINPISRPSAPTTTGAMKTL